MPNKIRHHAAISLAILSHGFSGWGGGVDFLRFCANALVLASRDKDIRLTIVLPDPEKNSLADRLKAVTRPPKNWVKSLLGMAPGKKKAAPEFTRKQLVDSFSNIDGSIEIVFHDSSREVTGYLSKHGIDVVIPSMYPLAAKSDLPWVGYLYDFQHKYFPDFFQPETLAKRDAQFLQMLTEARAIVVNSLSVKNDIARFFPATDCKIFNLPFSATPIEAWFVPADGLSEKYGLPEKYFIISNQFWIHKDHRTAFRALAEFFELTGRRDVHIVCTGKTEDFRCPDYFSQLQDEARELGIDGNIHCLGHIPKKDQIDILKGSIALLQPTLFEGGPGGGAVYDAVSMGVPALLSDIPVNREIEGERNLYYFVAGDASSLASRMADIITTDVQRPDKQVLLREGQARITDFGTTLLEAALYVKDQWHISL